jgi:hypothetical protein
MRAYIRRLEKINISLIMSNNWHSDGITLHYTQQQLALRRHYITHNNKCTK